MAKSNNYLQAHKELREFFVTQILIVVLLEQNSNLVKAKVQKEQSFLDSEDRSLIIVWSRTALRRLHWFGAKEGFASPGSAIGAQI